MDRAIADHTRAIELDPTYAAAYYNRGVAHDGKGDSDDAIADYTRAIEIEPKFASACIARVLVRPSPPACWPAWHGRSGNAVLKILADGSAWRKRRKWVRSESGEAEQCVPLVVVGPDDHVSPGCLI